MTVFVEVAGLPGNAQRFVAKLASGYYVPEEGEAMDDLYFMIGVAAFVLAAIRAYYAFHTHAIILKIWDRIRPS